MKWLRLGWCLILWLALLAPAATARLQAQELPTPTPNAAGFIIVVVAPGDTLLAIAARASIPLAELLALNDITEDEFIIPGQELIVGIVERPQTPTPDIQPSPTVTLPPPTPLPPSATPPTTAVCLTAFQDDNANGVFDAGENLQVAVAFTIFNETAVAANYVTDGVSEPACLELEPGSYQITRSQEQGETLTSRGDQAVVLNSGDVMYLAFGGTTGSGSDPVAPAPEPSTAVPPPLSPVVTAVAGEPPLPPVEPGAAAPPASISLIPIGAVIIVGLLLTIGLIFFLRTRPK